MTITSGLSETREALLCWRRQQCSAPMTASAKISTETAQTIHTFWFDKDLALRILDHLIVKISRDSWHTTETISQSTTMMRLMHLCNCWHCTFWSCSNWRAVQKVSLSQMCVNIYFFTKLNISDFIQVNFRYVFLIAKCWQGMVWQHVTFICQVASALGSVLQLRFKFDGAGGSTSGLRSSVLRKNRVEKGWPLLY